MGVVSYQGLTRDHYLEVDLGDDAPKSGPLYLIAQGSMHDTESSINVAITQGSAGIAHGLSLEVPDGQGGWIAAQDNLGFPAGRKKTVLFNLTNVFRPGHAAPSAAADQSGNLLGRDRVGARRCQTRQLKTATSIRPWLICTIAATR